MDRTRLDSRLPLIQDADLENRVVLVRVDHNVVKKGEIKDPFRIDATFPTLYRIAEQGGRPILMTHVGRPRDKKTGKITEDGRSSVLPIVQYLERKLDVQFTVPMLEAEGDLGIQDIGPSMDGDLSRLRERRIPGIYLPNTRCFQGEEGKGVPRERFASRLGGLADVYVNDAFGSWQAHASTFDVTRRLPSFAGLLMQRELLNLERVLEPRRPFLAVVAGAKYDTKIGPLRRIHERVDHLILGGIIYNAYLCARYGIRVQGVREEDVRAADELVAMDRESKKIVELPLLEESDLPDSRKEGRHRTRRIRDFSRGRQYGFFLDAAPESFDDPGVGRFIDSARTVFVNAVMGFVPHFTAGTERLNREIAKNRDALKLFGGGDTLQELKRLNPGIYMSALDDPSCYFFTGGGTVLKAIEEGSPYGLEPVHALIENGGRPPGSVPGGPL
ncbi:MAG: phosphoglycerate kinase [Deltaproteobacteria bacterium]|nr:phosphoglycerate kinase [Deltaproteobacteria bacterium]